MDDGCPICLNTLRGPYTLKCGHSFCTICLTDLQEAVTRQGSHPLKCPMCRQPSTDIPNSLVYHYKLSDYPPPPTSTLRSQELTRISRHFDVTLTKLEVPDLKPEIITVYHNITGGNIIVGVLTEINNNTITLRAGVCLNRIDGQVYPTYPRTRTWDIHVNCRFYQNTR